MSELHSSEKYTAHKSAAGDERTELAISALRKGWSPASGSDQANDWFWITFQPGRRASFTPGLHEVTSLLPDAEQDELISVEEEEGIGPVILYEGKLAVSESYRALCAQLIDLTGEAQESPETNAEVLAFEPKNRV